MIISAELAHAQAHAVITPMKKSEAFVYAMSTIDEFVKTASNCGEFECSFRLSQLVKDEAYYPSEKMKTALIDEIRDAGYLCNVTDCDVMTVRW